MKKTIALLLAVVMLLSLAACGTEPPHDTNDQTGAIEQDDTTIPTPSTDENPEETEPTEGTEATEVTETTEATEPTEVLVTEPEKETELINGLRPEFKEAMDAYENFYVEYCDFMAKYKKNPTDFTLLAEYLQLLEEVAEMDEAFDQWEDEDLNDAELKYYLEVNNRVMQMLVDIM